MLVSNPGVLTRGYVLLAGLCRRCPRAGCARLPAQSSRGPPFEDRTCHARSEDTPRPPRHGAARRTRRPRPAVPARLTGRRFGGMGRRRARDTQHGRRRHTDGSPPTSACSLAYHMVAAAPQQGAEGDRVAMPAWAPAVAEPLSLGQQTPVVCSVRRCPPPWRAACAPAARKRRRAVRRVRRIPAQFSISGSRLVRIARRRGLVAVVRCRGAPRTGRDRRSPRRVAVRAPSLLVEGASPVDERAYRSTRSTAVSACWAAILHTGAPHPRTRSACEPWYTDAALCRARRSRSGRGGAVVRWAGAEGGRRRRASWRHQRRTGRLLEEHPWRH